MSKCNGTPWGDVPEIIKNLQCHKDNTQRLKTRVTKKVMTEAQKIVDAHGYWSDEYSTFVNGFDYTARTKIHNNVKR